MKYRQTRILGEGGFTKALRGLAVTVGTRSEEGNIFAVGDSRVAVFDPQGMPLRHWQTERPGFSIAIRPSSPPGGEGRDTAPAEGRSIWVGQAEQIEIFDQDGGRLDVWRDAKRLQLVTAIGFSRDGVLAADAVARCIRHYDRQGQFRNNIGDQHRKGGFHIPNGVVDFAVDAEGLVHVANPGMHRVERYTPEGELVGRFGRFDGVDPEGFPGCCNPTNVTLGEGGLVVVSEKAPPRAKVYDRQGSLLAVVADGDAFDLAAKNMDLAADVEGNVYVADTARRRICVFEPVAGALRFHEAHEAHEATPKGGK